MGCWAEPQPIRDEVMYDKPKTEARVGEPQGPLHRYGSCNGGTPTRRGKPCKWNEIHCGGEFSMVCNSKCNMVCEIK